MKALSLWQPWASALFAPRKQVAHEMIKIDETRSWPCPKSMIGVRMAIHAAKRWTKEEQEFWDGLTHEDRIAFAALGIMESRDLPRGYLVGTAILQRCVRTEEAGVRVGSSNYSWGNFGPDRFAWRYIEHDRFEKPIPCVGRQGIFDVDLNGLSAPESRQQGELFA